MPPVARAPRPELSAGARRFQRRLLGWYRRHRRELPWRRTDDPYHILVSEIMLQQTQVDRVIPKYHEFLARYPTLESLAEAETAEVKRTWYPARLQRAAREPARHRARDARPLRRAAARRRRRPPVACAASGGTRRAPSSSFAYRRDAALVDTNVRRVLGRVFLGPRRLRRLRGDKVIWALAETLIPPKPGLRLQPGPHGLRRHLVHGPRAALPALSHEGLLRHVRGTRPRETRRASPRPSLTLYLPVNEGGRRSRKWATPSLKSPRVEVSTSLLNGARAPDSIP